MKAERDFILDLPIAPPDVRIEHRADAECACWPSDERIDLALEAVNAAARLANGLRQTRIESDAPDAAQIHAALVDAVVGRIQRLCETASMLLCDDVFTTDDARAAIRG